MPDQLFGVGERLCRLAVEHGFLSRSARHVMLCVLESLLHTCPALADEGRYLARLVAAGVYELHDVAFVLRFSLRIAQLPFFSTHCLASMTRFCLFVCVVSCLCQYNTDTAIA